VILADYSVPGYDGLSALAAAQKQCPQVPFIFVSNPLAEKEAIESLDHGATDYVLKDHLARLRPAVCRALREREERRKGEQPEQQRHEAEARLRKQKRTLRSEPGGPLPTADKQRLVHELQVHQIELEMQNEELSRASAQAEVAADKFSNLYDFAPVGYLTLDRKGAIRQVNLRGARLLGLERARLLNRRLALLVAEADRLALSDFLESVFGGEAKKHCEVTLPRAGSQPLVVQIEGTRSAEEQECRAVLFDLTERKQAEAALQHAYDELELRVAARTVDLQRANEQLRADIIERKRAEAALSESEAHFRAMFDMASIGMAQADPQSGQFVRVNQKMCAITGYSAAELLVMRVAELTHPDDRQQDGEKFGRVVRGGAPDYRMEKRYVRKDRAVAWVNVNMTVIRDAAGQPTRTMATIEDITERKRSEESLRENERRYRLLFNSGYDAVFVHQGGSAGNGSGKFIEVNDIACQRLGYTREELLQMTPRDITAPETLPGIPRIRAKLAMEKPAVSEGVQLTKDGRRIAVEISTQVFKLNGKRTLLSTVRDITERKCAEAVIRESGQFNQQIVTSAQEGIIVYGRDLKYLVWNSFMEQLTGLPADQVLGKHPDELFPFLREAGVLALIEKALAGEPTPPMDFHYKGLPSGKSGWLCDTTGPLRNAAGEIIGVIGIVRDITERKRSELRTAAFAKLGQRLSAAKTAKEAGKIIVDVADQLFGWDCCLFHLYSAHENRLSNVLCMDVINGRRTECNLPGFSRPATELARRAIEQGGQLILGDQPDSTQVETVLFGDTSRPSASIMYVPVRHGTETVGVLSIQSYTPGAYDAYSLETLQALADHCGGALDRLRMEEGWQNTQQRLSRLLTQSPAVIYSLKTDGKTTEPAWVSDNVERLLGYASNECYGPHSLFGQLHPQDRQGAVDSLAQLFANKQIARDYRVQHKNGEYRWLRDEQRLVCDAEGAPVEIVGSWVDITERKALEEQLRQAQKMEAVGQLAGGVAHDFNNMLAVIRGNAELLLMDEEQHAAETREALKHVVQASERAANLTRQLLAFSRKHVLQLQPLVLNDVIANLTKMLNRVISENIDLQCHYATALPCVQADTGMMEQVILNLVVNARDAMPEGGQLRVTTKQLRLDEAHARVNPSARAGEFICLLVSDTGTGIAPEILSRIFEPFFTTKEVGKGTGLGLATVYGIVQQHQGWVEVSSQVGKGTTFEVFLPAIPAPAGPAAAAETVAEVRRGTETVLLVEDEHSVRLTTRRVLESKGYRILEANSAPEALELWQSHAGEIALLLTDIVMPGDMTGRDLADQLWGQRPGLKVIFMSGYSADVLGTNGDFIRRTRSHFLQKPSSSRAILETVRQCLDEKESVAAPGEGGGPE
jgi:two-component system cell cycle sensor histidine kinase/response regulator CckA